MHEALAVLAEGRNAEEAEAGTGPAPLHLAPEVVSSTSEPVPSLTSVPQLIGGDRLRQCNSHLLGDLFQKAAFIHDSHFHE